jgi:choline dehydrogenase-like flavoprotein
MGFIDARELDRADPIESDVCIVGGGAAGLTLAKDLLRQGWRVCIVESGGRTYDAATQRLYAGRNIGLTSYPLSQARVRMLGGSTTRWAAQCRMMERLDFERRDWIADSGWPFKLDHLKRFYAKAAETCQLSGFDVNAPEALPPDTLSLDHDDLRRVKFCFGHPTDFGEIFGPSIAQHPNGTICLHSNATEIELNEGAGAVRAIRAKTLNGRTLRFIARNYVLACGGVENPRLLLASRETMANGVGNMHDLVGRYFMDHPYITTGYLDPSDPKLADGHHIIRTFKRVGWEQEFHSGFTLSEDAQQREGLSGAVAYLIRRLASETTPDYYLRGIRARNRLRDAWRFRTSADVEVGRDVAIMLSDPVGVTRTLLKRAAEIVKPRRLMALRTVVETTPRADSRVLLDRELDALGQQRAVVDWRVSADDRRGLDHLRRTLATAFEQQGLGRMIDDWSLKDDGWPPSTEGGRHHMGTTRMSTNPHRGVVDAHCRVHGLANLFVAGSSVFPTGSYVNPTLTIVALTHRLADHLDTVLSRP